MATFLRRALLYVPGTSQRMLNKSLAFNVDSIIYDLEDSVLPEAKDAARQLVSKHLESIKSASTPRLRREVAVRINAVSTGLALKDITEIVGSQRGSLDTIVLPKVESPADLHFVHDMIKHLEHARSNSSQCDDPAELQTQPISVLALIESARGLADIHAICRTGQSLGILSGLAFAAEDFAADLSLSHLPDRRELLFARSSIVTAARAYDIPSRIDLVPTTIPTNDEQKTKLSKESLEGRALGFTGKQCIHPSQVDIVQAAYGPSDADLEWAVAVDVGDIVAKRQGKGAWKLGGKMVDAPVLKKAREILQHADQLGFDLTAIREKVEDASNQDA